MTSAQQERVAREILGWFKDQCLGLPMTSATYWLWPLETALMERGWQFTRINDPTANWAAWQRGREAEYKNTHAEAVNAAALVEISE